MSKPVRILHVEDQPESSERARQKVCQAFSDCDWQQVANLSDCLTALQAFQPDLILANYQLSSFDGLDLLKALATYSTKIPIIILTDPIDEATAVACMKAGAADYVTKDRMEALGTAVQQALQKQAQHNQRQQTQKALTDQASSLQKLQNLAQIGTYLFDIRTGKWSSSPIFDQIFGIDETYPKDIDGWSRLVHHAYEGKIRKQLTKFILEGDTEYDKEYPIVRFSDGQQRWIYAERTLETNEKGQAITMLGTVQDITERYRAEEALQLTRFSVDNVADAVYWVDRDTKFVDINETACRQLGYTREEMLELSVTDIDPNFVLEQWANIWEENKTLGKRIFTTQHRTKNGALLPVEVIGNFLDFQGQELICAVVRNMADREAAEKRLRESEERLQKFSDVTTEGIIFHHQGIIYDANPPLTKMFGYRLDEVIGHSLLEFIPPAEHQRILQKIAQETEKPYESLGLRKDGSIFPVEVVARSFDYQGAELRVACLLDISERKQAEQALQQSEERLKQAVQVAGIGTFDHNHLTDDIYFSLELRQMWGFGPDEYISIATMMERIHVEDRQRIAEAINEAHSPWGNGRYHVEQRVIHPNNSLHWHSVRAQTFFAGEGAAKHPVRTIGAVLDITDARQAEEAQAKLEEQLRQSQKLESLGRLAGGIAHDFNNLLVPMIGYTELGQMKLPADSKAHAYFEKIGKAATRAADLTKQILAFSRRQMLEMGLFDLNEIVWGFKEMLERLIGEDIRMQIFPAPGPCPISADRTQIEQILLNLVLNARDAMPDGGQLIIETDTVYLDESYARTHPDTEPGHYALLSISDTGQGMDIETQAQIFDPFFTTKMLGKGTGLGLATVFGIVKQHQGHIWVYSELEEGTTFKIYLPRPADATQIDAISVPEIPTVYGTETVLVVEDEPMVRKLACETLAAYGYTVLEAESAQHSLHIATAHPGAIHLLLTDVIMPDINGRDLYNKIMKIRPDIKVLFMSGYTDNVIVHHGVLDEGVNFLEKPFTIRNFSQKIRWVLDE